MHGTKLSIEVKVSPQRILLISEFVDTLITIDPRIEEALCQKFTAYRPVSHAANSISTWIKSILTNPF
jgi:hypothetical protein